jgi:hypothetical protein
LFLLTQCPQVRNRIPLYADNQLEKDERKKIRKHLDHCESCQRLLFQHRSQMATLATLGLDDLLRVRLLLEAELWSPARWSQRLFALLLLAICGLFVYFSIEVIQQKPLPSSRTTPSGPLVISVFTPAPVAKVSPKVKVIPLPQAVSVQDKVPDPIAELAPAPELTVIPKPTLPLPLKPSPAKKAPAKVDEPKLLTGAALFPRMFVSVPKASNAPKSPPKAILGRLGRLGLGSGFRYGELLFFPIIDQTEFDLSRLKASRLPMSGIAETSPPFPTRILVSRLGRRETWPLMPGLLVEAPWGWRIVRHGLEKLDQQAIVTVIPIVDPDVLFLERLGSRFRRFRRKNLLAAPMAPLKVRRALMRQESNGHVRRALWDSFLDGSDGIDPNSKSPFVPANTLKSHKLTRSFKIRRLAIESEITELSRRLRHIFVLQKGLRGIALSMGDKPYSLDIFGGPIDTLRAISSLLQGLALDAFEASLYTPISGSGRALLKRRTETQGLHQLLLGLTRNLKSVSDPHRFSYEHPDKALKSTFLLTLSADQRRIKHLIIVKS